jgi:hypothetical protein
LIGFLINSIKQGSLHQILESLTEIRHDIQTPPQRNLRWVPWLAYIVLLLSFTLAFAPPGDAFDALLYHLAVPASWLKEGGFIGSSIIPIYFYPGLVEGMFVWAIGVINTSSLWQSRLLIPAHLPLAPLAALVWEDFSKLDSQRLHLSFIISSLLFLTVVSTVFDFGSFVFSRNPIPYALKLQDIQIYLEKIQPSYADALSLVNQTPPAARIYFIYEPRSYGMGRQVVPDVLNTNISHDFYLYQTPENILNTWQSRGYTHLLYQINGERFFENPAGTQELFDLMELVSETHNSRLYKIPSP